MLARLAFILLLTAAPALAADLSGPARVIDGDGLEIAGQAIRLHGIDAPELDRSCQVGGAAVACGERSRSFLEGLTAGRRVTVPGDRPGTATAVWWPSAKPLARI